MHAPDLTDVETNRTVQRAASPTFQNIRSAVELRTSVTQTFGTLHRNTTVFGSSINLLPRVLKSRN